ncbi:hypothetical protein SUGI_0141090 [Cryptomeria japonica]|nr:hypothetical protein SUGI_0141090 [Cryptomeria japonica]
MDHRKSARKSLRITEVSVDILQKEWERNLNEDQRSAFQRAGIVPFLGAVVYRAECFLCGAIIECMEDGKLAIGNHVLEITEKTIQRITALPSSGKDVSVAHYSPHDRIALKTSLTNSQDGATVSGLQFDLIRDPAIQFAAKFLVFRLLGIKQERVIPFKNVQTAIELSKGVQFNWCNFIKERILHHIGRIQKNGGGRFNYPTILQALALEAFNNPSMPSKVISDGEPYINAFILCGRNIPKTAEENKMIRQGISDILDYIKKCGHLQSSSKNSLKQRDISKGSLVLDGAIVTKRPRTTIGLPRMQFRSFLRGQEESSFLPSARNNSPEDSGKQMGLEANGHPTRDESSEFQADKLSNALLEQGQLITDSKLTAVKAEISQLLSQRLLLEAEKSKWVAEKIALESEIMVLAQEKEEAVAKRQQANQEKSKLQAENLKQIERNKIIKRRLDKLNRIWY